MLTGFTGSARSEHLARILHEHHPSKAATAVALLHAIRRQRRSLCSWQTPSAMRGSARLRSPRGSWRRWRRGKSQRPVRP